MYIFYENIMHIYGFEVCECFAYYNRSHSSDSSVMSVMSVMNVMSVMSVLAYSSYIGSLLYIFRKNIKIFVGY